MTNVALLPLLDSPELKDNVLEMTDVTDIMDLKEDARLSRGREVRRRTTFVIYTTPTFATLKISTRLVFIKNLRSPCFSTVRPSYNMRRQSKLANTSQDVLGPNEMDDFLDMAKTLIMSGSHSYIFFVPLISLHSAGDDFYTTRLRKRF